jgi:glutamine amidotransferase
MCRLIVAAGTFRAIDILDAAVAMASGETAEHDGPFVVHPDGWGAVWRNRTSPTGLSMFREARPAQESALDSPVAAVETDFLAIHVRRAGDESTKGLRFTHPLQRRIDDWVFMHNGSQPTVHRMLGLERSTFDSAEYFDYIVPAGALMLEERRTLERLQAIPPGGNSGNALAVRRGLAYVIHSWSAGKSWARYFTMHQLVNPGCRIVSSEVIRSLAPERGWEAVRRHAVIEFRLEESAL